MSVARSPRTVVSPVPRGLLDDAETLPGVLERLVERFPDFECLIVLNRRLGEQRLSLAEFWRRSRTIQAALVERGVEPGDIALLVLPTGPELVSAYFGVILAGGVPGVLATPSHRLSDPLAYAAHVGRILDNAGARILYTGADVAKLFRGHDAP
ncbi:MAG: AMP-binding protein, partial [Candidatus Binatia bacterium]